MATSTATAKTEKAESKKATGLRKPQVRILKALAKSGAPMTRNEISVKAPVDLAACVEYLGSHDPEVRHANDAKHFKSLITWGYVKFATTGDEDAGMAYQITPKGRAAARKADEA